MSTDFHLDPTLISRSSGAETTFLRFAERVYSCFKMAMLFGCVTTTFLLALYISGVPIWKFYNEIGSDIFS